MLLYFYLYRNCPFQANKLYSLWNRGIQRSIQKGHPIIHVLSQINPIPRVDNYFFKIYFNIVQPTTPKPFKKSVPAGLTFKILKALLHICPPHIFGNRTCDLIHLKCFQEDSSGNWTRSLFQTKSIIEFPRGKFRESNPRPTPYLIHL